MKSLLLAPFILFASEASAAPTTGVWRGFADYKTGNPQYGHEVDMGLSCDGGSGDAKYYYPGLDTECASQLTLLNVTGPMWLYQDTTLTPENNCIDGFVRVTVLWDCPTPDPLSCVLSDKAYFEWLPKAEGLADNAGEIKLRGSMFCN